MQTQYQVGQLRKAEHMWDMNIMTLILRLFH